MADISFNIARKEPKIAQIAQLNQIFQLLPLVHIYGLRLYEISRMLIRSTKIQQIFAYNFTCEIAKLP